MKTKPFGKTGIQVSQVGLGCWQLGGGWGKISDATSQAILAAAVDHGMTFFDTADVYGDGRSERRIASFLKDRSEQVFVATKVGRTGDLYPDKYNEETMRQRIEMSLDRLQVEALDLIQLHCIPAEVMADGAVFEWLRDFKRQGLIREFGASVESMDEALLCLQQDDLCSLQIIFNIFRQKPIHTIFATAKAKEVALIIRLPLASGLLAGKFTAAQVFAASDHRNFNRDGQFFNVGETFAGLPFEKGVELADALKPLAPKQMTMAQWAMRWILDYDAVTVVIPGASRPEQVMQNAAVADLAPLDEHMHRQLAEFYEKSVQDHIRGPY
ncbi:aldo/keto reductase [candidate division KSB1 bacterium]|nr:aldo/keto reductase [candidate division KSB1 bacterium]